MSFVNEILKCHRSNETHWAELSRCTVSSCSATEVVRNFCGVCGWNTDTEVCQTFLWCLFFFPSLSQEQGLFVGIRCRRQNSQETVLSPFSFVHALFFRNRLKCNYTIVQVTLFGYKKRRHPAKTVPYVNPVIQLIPVAIYNNYNFLEKIHCLSLRKSPCSS